MEHTPMSVPGYIYTVASRYPLYVCVAHIVSVSPSGRYTTIRTTSGESIGVDEPLEAVMQKIKAARGG